MLMGLKLFTNEFEPEFTATTILDTDAQYPDVELIIDDAGVFIRQWPIDETKPADLVCMSHKMFHDMLEALKLPEGAYVTRYTKE